MRACVRACVCVCVCVRASVWLTSVDVVFRCIVTRCELPLSEASQKD